MPIKSFADKKTAQFVSGERVKDYQSIEKAAAKAITKLQAAVLLGDLRNPPSNRFERLGGDRNGQFSIRINDQYRVCFRWAPAGPVEEGTDLLQTPGDSIDVEITDYH